MKHVVQLIYDMDIVYLYSATFWGAKPGLIWVPPLVFVISMELICFYGLWLLQEPLLTLLAVQDISACAEQ